MDNHTDIADMSDITISEARIYQLFTPLDERKASGSDPYITLHSKTLCRLNNTNTICNIYSVTVYKSLT